MPFELMQFTGLFQSQTGFSSHSDAKVRGNNGIGHGFQSQTGFSSHSDLYAFLGQFLGKESFNPKRAFQVIPTPSPQPQARPQRKFQSQTGFSSHSDSQTGGLALSFSSSFNPKRAFQVIPTAPTPQRPAHKLVSIPNGLFKSFRP